MNTITSNTRVSYKGKSGTVVSIALHGMAYFNPDTNKRGNDGMKLVEVSALKPIK